MNTILAKQQSLSWPLHIAALIILALISAIIYSNSFKAPFVFDDLGNIVEVTSVQMTTLNYESLQRATFEGRLPRRWLPNLSFGLNYYFGGHEVWGYHLLNLVVHILTAMVLYGLFFTTLTLPRLNFSPRRAAEISLISAMVWAVHPLQTNAVTYIVQRMTSMAALFYLSALLFYVRGRLLNRFEAKRYAFWAASLLCGLMALVSKENSAMLPPIILAYEFYFLRDGKRRINYRKSIVSLGISLLSILAIGWVYIGHSSLLAILGNFKYRDFTLVERLLTETRIIFHYLSLIVLPLPSRLNFDYDYTISSSLLSPPLTLVATLGIACLIGLTIYLFRRHRLLSFGLLWFLANLLIESTIIPLELVFEHRLYLPSSMLILAVVALSYGLWGMRQQVLPLLWTIVIIVLCLFTWQRNVVWGSELSFWQDVVDKSPGKARGNDSLGSAHYREGDLDRATKYYEQAVSLDPSFYKAYDNLGKTYLETGLIDKSIKAHRKAIKIKPTFSKAYFNLGAAYFNKGLKDEAIRAFQQAIKINPSFSRAYFNLGVAYTNKGLKDESIKAFQKATETNPSYSRAYFMLGSAYLNKGLMNESIKAFQQVIKN
jgi:tetratricopeptide (TPR) repeat protein